jgi:hypothetical protein
MTNKYEDMLHPAIFMAKASGHERTLCELCRKKLEKDMPIIECFSSSYKGNHSYTTRFCRKCFTKVIVALLPELFDKKLMAELKKELLVEGLEK